MPFRERAPDLIVPRTRSVSAQLGILFDFEKGSTDYPPKMNFKKNPGYVVGVGIPVDVVKRQSADEDLTEAAMHLMCRCASSSPICHEAFVAQGVLPPTVALLTAPKADISVRFTAVLLLSKSNKLFSGYFDTGKINR